MVGFEPPPPRLKLGIAITLVAFLFLSMASALVYGFRNRFPTIQIIFIQNLVSLLVILPLALRKGVSYLKTSVLPLHLLRDLMGVASYFLFFLAIRYLNLVDATLLNYTAPFFVPFIWRIWRNERIAKNIWWSIGLGFVGMAIILHPRKEIFALGFFYGLFAGIASAIAFTALRVLNLKGEPMRRTLFYYFLLGSLCSLPFAFSVWEQPTPREWIEAIAIGVATAVGQMLLTIAYRYGTASFLSPIGYVSVIYNGAIAALFFGQTFSWRTLVGTLFIIVGGTLTYLLRQKPKTVLESLTHPEKKPPL